MKPYTILVVEDDAAALMLTKRVLRKSLPDANIEVAMDGEEAIRAVNASTEADATLPIIVLLDWNLPRKHGREVLAEIRANPKTTDLPIIIVTSSNAGPDQHEAFDLGANDFVQKCLSLDEFRENLSKTCQKFLPENRD